MAKLYFRYGAMGSAKTLNLLAVRHNYDLQGKRVVLVKPAVDSRYGTSTVRSRSGLEYPADLVVQNDEPLDLEFFQGAACVLLDECQFLSAYLIEQFRELTRALQIPVIAYGLRTDFRTHLFEGSRRLMELADTIEEVKTTCMFCNRKAVLNLRHDLNGEAVLDGPVVMMGADLQYSPTCYSCYHERTQRARAREACRA